MSKNIQAIYPLSPLQEGILFHTIEAPSSDIYFQQFSCKLDNLHDAERWRQAWQTLSTRHAIMRTLFTWENRAQPLQIVRERVSMPFTQLDWQDKTPDTQAQDWQQLQQLDRDTNFELSTAPLMRFTLAKLSSSSYQFLFSFHHIVLDGWSQRLLLEEAMNIYNQSGAIDASEEAKPEASSFAQFIDYLQKTDKQAAKAFWSKTLAGFTQATNIVNSQSDSGGQSNQHDDNIRSTRELTLSTEQLSNLQKQARAHQLTLNSLILGAWSLVLASHNRTNDVLFGTTVAGRPIDLPQSDKIAGLFINTLPCRVELNSEISLSQWLSKLQSSQAKCRQFEHTPLTDIQRCSELGAGNSLFESIVVVENLPPTKANEKEHTLKISQTEYTEYSHYPLAILVDPSNGLKLIAVHQISKISRSRADDVLKQLYTVLLQMSHSLDKPVSSIDTLPKSYRQDLEKEWKTKQVDFGDVCAIHQVFEQQACKHASLTAIIQQQAEDELSDIENSFEQVNQAANRLARALIERGVKKGDIVPVLLNKSADAIISFLAVMKTGAAYVALDPEQPASRLNLLMESLEMDNLVLISAEIFMQETFGEQYSRSITSVLLLDTQKETLSAYSPENLGIKVEPNDAAYLIFTSGSTGTPKGVVVEHASLFNSTFARTHYYQQTALRFLLLSSLTTDSSVAGIYWALLSAGTLVLPVNKIEQDMLALERLISSYRINHTLCVPSLYSVILEHINAEVLGGLNAVIVAGEKCPTNIIQIHNQKLPNTHLFNEYGPSECCVWASVSCLSQNNHSGNVSIGKAIANTQLYVVDNHLKAVLPNVVGELYIAGNNLARGYLHQEIKTKQVFVANPYFDPKLNNPLMYKTGDLVKWDEYGELVFVGRADNQIKIRGFRLEPEEIEQVLMSHDDIDEALVTVEKQTLDDAQLLNALMSLDVDDAKTLLLEIETSSQTGTLG